MNTFVDLLVQNGVIISVIGQFLTALFVLYLSTKFAPKSLEEDVTNLQGRIQRIEIKLENIPTKDDLHRLEKKIMELNGELKRVDENLDASEAINKRVEYKINNIDQFLRGKS